MGTYIGLVSNWLQENVADSPPLALGRNEVVQPKFPVDLFQPKMDGIIVELGLRYAVGGDRSG